METQEILISIIPLILVVALLVYTARGITSGKGFETVRQVVPAVIVVLVAIAIIGAVSDAGGGGGDDPGDEGDVPMEMMVFEISNGRAVNDDDESYAILVGISEEYEVPEGGYRLVVPTTYQGYPVTGVEFSESFDGDYPPFFDCVSVSSQSITTIGHGIFSDTSLASASFPAATTIGEHVFYECESIEAVELGPLESIDADSFNSWTFYDTDGTTVLQQTAANLKNSTFQGTASALVKVAPGRTSLDERQLERVQELTAAAEERWNALTPIEKAEIRLAEIQDVLKSADPESRYAQKLSEQARALESELQELRRQASEDQGGDGEEKQQAPGGS